MTEAIAESRFARYTSRKVGPVLHFIRKKNAAKAIVTLNFASKRSARFIAKTLNSALSNLSNKLNKKVDPKEAWVTGCWVNEAPALKRMRPGSMGRAFPYKKRACHLTIKVSDEPLTRSVHGTKS